MARKRNDWIESWVEYSSPLPSPGLWRRWAGIFILAAAMERRLWIKTSIGNLYPNLYVVLVGPPGVGKTLMTSQVRNFLYTLTDEKDQNAFHLAAASETHASLVDSLKDATRRYIPPDMGEIQNYNALTLVSNELGVLLPEYDPAMMSKLTDLYDGYPYSERRRGNNINFTIPSPTINMIAATTPSFLVDTLPEGAWDQGFLSRSMLAFSAETMYRDLFSDIKFQDVLVRELGEDLRRVFALYGKMSFTDEAVSAIQNWDSKGRPPLPDHPKLLHYNTRRAAHLLKLCMVACISSGDTLQITIDHFRTAMDWLLEIENYMPEIFKAMSGGGDARAMEECWYYIATLYARENGKPIAEGRIIAYLAERIPAQNVGRVLEVMISTGIFIEETTGMAGKFYRPRGRKS